MSEERTIDEERIHQPLLAFEPLRELIWELVGFTPEQAERNMKRLEECMKRIDAKDAKQRRNATSEDRKCS